MKKIISVLFLILNLYLSLSAASTDSSSDSLNKSVDKPNSMTVDEAVPYGKDEFPQWLKDVRRTEIIALGSWPFTTLLVTLGYSFQNYAAHDFSSSYFPNPFSKSDGAFDSEQIGTIILTSSLVSCAIAITDLTVNLIKRHSKHKNNSEIDGNVTVTASSSDEKIFAPFDFQNRNSSCLIGNMESAVF